MAERDSLGEPIEDPQTHRMIGGARIKDSVSLELRGACF